MDRAPPVPAPPAADPYLRPHTTLRNRLARLAWAMVYAVLFRPSPRPFHAWRSVLLTVFGARMGHRCKIYPRARIWAPWNLHCDDVAAVADDAEIYNPSPIHLGSHCIVSQHAFLCGATHDYDDPAFPMVSAEIRIGPYAWVCARATVLMGVTVNEGAVLGLGSVATRDLEPWTVYAGLPARKIKLRRRA